MSLFITTRNFSDVSYLFLQLLNSFVYNGLNIVLCLPEITDDQINTQIRILSRAFIKLLNSFSIKLLVYLNRL